MVDAPPASFTPTGTRSRSFWDELDLLNILNGTGIPERAAALNELLNPLAAIPRAQAASREMFAPNRSTSERVASLGQMLGEVAGVAAPMAGGVMAGRPAINALAEGLTGVQATAGNALGDAADVGRRFVADESGALRLGGADTPEMRAQIILDMLQSGRAGEITDDMLDLGDPVANARFNQYLYRNYDLPMDEASRMQRAGEMGFDTGTPLYHGTTADVSAFDLARSGQVGEDFGPALFTSTSPNIASGYAGLATGNSDWRALIPAHESALSEWGRAVVAHGPDAPQAIQARGKAQTILDQMNEIQADVEAFRAPSDGGNVMPVTANARSYPRYQGGGDHWFRVNSAAINDARQSGAAGLRIEDVIDSATTPTAEIADTVISFDPSNIRSRFARFDPRLAHLKNLSAGVAGVGFSGAALAPQDAQAGVANGNALSYDANQSLEDMVLQNFQGGRR